MALAHDREDELEGLLNKGALWAVTYGDLMSYLMIFFLIMFTLSLKDKNAGERLSAVQTHFGGVGDSKAIQQLRVRDRETAIAHELQKNFDVRVTEEKIRVILDEKVLFDPGKAELKPAVFPALKKFSELAGKVPNPVAIEGHTDNVPIRKGRYDSNFELSMARAYVLLKFLIEDGKIAPERMSAAGYGEFKPVAPNDTPEQRAQNRRIEVNLIRTK